MSEDRKGSSGGGAGAGGGGGAGVPTGVHHHVVPTERCGALNVYIQVMIERTVTPVDVNRDKQWTFLKRIQYCTMLILREIKQMGTAIALGYCTVLFAMCTRSTRLLCFIWGALWPKDCILNLFPDSMQRSCFYCTRPDAQMQEADAPTHRRQ